MLSRKWLKFERNTAIDSNCVEICDSFVILSQYESVPETISSITSLVSPSSVRLFLLFLFIRIQSEFGQKMLIVNSFLTENQEIFAWKTANDSLYQSNR